MWRSEKHDTWNLNANYQKYLTRLTSMDAANIHVITWIWARQHVGNEGRNEEGGGDGGLTLSKSLLPGRGTPSPWPCAKMGFLSERVTEPGVDVVLWICFPNCDQKTSPNIITYWWPHMKSYISISPNICDPSEHTVIHSNSSDLFASAPCELLIVPHLNINDLICIELEHLN